MRSDPRSIARLLWLGVWWATPVTTLAYRPFTGTDAAVADWGVSEVELGVLSYAHAQGRDTLVTPELRYNLGIVKNWEAVLEGGLQVFDSGSRTDLQLRDPQFNLKGVLVDGPLQGSTFPVSLAVEVGALLPETLAGSGAGFQGAVIGSFRMADVTFHLNAGGALARQTLEPTGIWGVIVERPIARGLRLAAEFNGEFSGASRAENSVLVGLLWDRKKVTYDAGVRLGLTESAPDAAVTVGLTFRF